MFALEDGQFIPLLHLWEVTDVQWCCADRQRGWMPQLQHLSLTGGRAALLWRKWLQIIKWRISTLDKTACTFFFSPHSALDGHVDYCGAAHQLSGHQENTRVADLARRQSLLLQRWPACSASCSPEPRAALAARAERQEPLGRLIRLGRRWSSESWSTCSCSSASSNNAADQVHPRLPLCGHLKQGGLLDSQLFDSHQTRWSPLPLSLLFLVRLIWQSSWTGFYSPGPSRAGKASHGEGERRREIGFSPGVFMPVMRSITLSVAG